MKKKKKKLFVALFALVLTFLTLSLFTGLWTMTVTFEKISFDKKFCMAQHCNTIIFSFVLIFFFFLLVVIFVRNLDLGELCVKKWKNSVDYVVSFFFNWLILI